MLKCSIIGCNQDAEIIFYDQEIDPSIQVRICAHHAVCIYLMVRVREKPRPTALGCDIKGCLEKARFRIDENGGKGEPLLTFLCLKHWNQLSPIYAKIPEVYATGEEIDVEVEDALERLPELGKRRLFESLPLLAINRIEEALKARLNVGKALYNLGRANYTKIKDESRITNPNQVAQELRYYVNQGLVYKDGSDYVVKDRDKLRIYLDNI